MKKLTCIILAISILGANLYSINDAYRLEAYGSTSAIEVFNRFREVLANGLKTYFGAEEAVPAVSLAPPVLLINGDNMLERDFRPENMIDISPYVRSQRSPMLLEESAGNAYIRMVTSMHEYGITNLAAISGFRDWEHQNTLHNNRINSLARHIPLERAKEVAKTIVAPPGASEHQSGLAIDVSSACIGFALSERFENTPAFRWLAENAHNYGFIIRYPRDSMTITGVIFEPWHLRYVGVDHAARIFEADLLLEEYIEMYMEGAWSE